MISRFFLLLKKDLLLELRSKETLVLLISTGLLISAVVGAGISSTFLELAIVKRIFATLLWLVFLLVATIAVIRSHDGELEGHAYEGLMIAGVSPTIMYLSKFVALWGVLFLGFIAINFSLQMLLGISFSAQLDLIFKIGLPVTGAYSSLVAMLIGISSTSRLKGVILPIISIPLCFPIFFAATELTSEIILRGAIDLGSPWFSILIVSWTVYVLAGVNLYRYVIGE